MFSLLVALFIAHCTATHVGVVGYDQFHPEVRLATLDAHRYIRLLLCGASPGASCTSFQTAHDFSVSGGSTIIIAPRDALPLELATTISSALEGDSHLVHTTRTAASGHNVTVCTGATPRAVLYAVYTMLEELGARFYMDSDAIPPPNPNLTFLPLGTIVRDAKFATRGLQPFHDFPMGPDWWDLGFWRQTATQMAKMKMNFWGFHTYPIASQIQEPLVWVGLATGYNHTTGAVMPSAAYESSWYLYPRLF